ncbi:uncharacterized protein BYT42DRAFT_574658 [Radiomyces spectabilis]|uniref:uncharacterized protein n=1 Tax=Radiomyces spectabilis TaxID=64574 RepID=UPI00221E91C8|nr:uncharacterized protein BYT42DRAFT_574658 [Radiomyces spectabilis]KAI8376453.1 hypothetical protein BYT42DRAFT_574658 [Radiomyces spectabilis]
MGEIGGFLVHPCTPFVPTSPHKTVMLCTVRFTLLYARLICSCHSRLTTGSNQNQGRAIK